MQQDLSSAAYSPFEWPEYYFASIISRILKAREVGVKPLGARWGIGPICIEEYRSDKEPDLAAGDPDGTAPTRLVLWRRPTRTDVPRDWRTSFIPVFGSLHIGYFDNLGPDYIAKWKSRARTYRNAWRRNLLDKKYSIKPLSYDEFAGAYAKSTVAREIPVLELRKLAARLERTPNHVRIWGVCDASGDVVAGLSVFDSYEHGASYYGSGFYVPEVRHLPVMVGLMDHWFAQSLAKNIKVMHLGIFMPPGSRGRSREVTISNFKAQFITDYLAYQPPLWRIVRKRR